MKNLVILGAGTAGTMAVNHLRRALPAREWAITVVDAEPDHLYQPGLIFLPFGKYEERQIVRPKKTFIPAGADFRIAPIDRIDPSAHAVHLSDGTTLPYDLLIIATGVKPAPEETPGMMTGVLWRKSIFDFYTLPGARALRDALARFEKGRVVIHVTEMPIKCPVAPLEFSFLANEFFTARGIRDKVTLSYVTPLDGAFTKPVASKHLGSLFADRNIEVVANFGTESINNDTKELVGYDGRRVPFDLLVTVPANLGDPLIQRSGMGDEMNLVPVDAHTLAARDYPGVFVVGDAGTFPTSKAGSVAHFQMETLVANVVHATKGEPLEPSFDGHANCFVESGDGKALLLDFNYDIEPLPGRFPSALVGPMTLLDESSINHWGKLAFRHIYWDLLMRGRAIPGIPSRMVPRTPPVAD